MKKVSFENLLPRDVIAAGITEVDDLNKIKEALASRTIISADRFLLEPGDYSYAGVRAATWEIGKGKNKKDAVMCVITFKSKDGKEFDTTLGSLRKIDSNMKNYGPDQMPVNEAELLDTIISRGIVIKKVVETTATVFDRETQTPAKDENGAIKTKPTKLMAWGFGPEKAKAGK